jgi:hypothetical protein
MHVHRRPSGSRRELQELRRNCRWPIAVVVATLTSLMSVPLAEPAAADNPTVQTRTFSGPGSFTFTVPPRIKVVAFNLMGAGGGGFAVNQSGVRADVGQGLGGRLSGLVVTKPGESLSVQLGGRGAPGHGIPSGSIDTVPGSGAGGSNGGGASGGSGAGGGGGMSTIAGPNGVFAVAGGGGGGHLVPGYGGAGGGLVGAPGTNGWVCGTSTNPAPQNDPTHQADGVSTGGLGGTPVLGGPGGTSTYGAAGGAGGHLQGGSGGSAASSDNVLPGGGGGGGWYGGGGGAGGFSKGSGSVNTSHCSGGGGGGGASFFTPPGVNTTGAVGVTAEAGVWPLDGHAVFSWFDDGGPTPAVVTVPPVAVSPFQSQTVTVTATVRDQDGNPMGGKVVAFERRGRNPGTATPTTNGNGDAFMTYTGITGGGADVITATTPSLLGVPVGGVGSVTWAEPPSATALEFVPPGAYAPSGTANLDFVARRTEYESLGRVTGSVRYSVGPLGVPGSWSGSKGFDEQGRGTITVTTSLSEVEVVAFVDRHESGTFGEHDPEEEALAFAVVSTRPVPHGSTVTFTPPVGVGSPESDVPLTFSATKADGGIYNGPVHWCAAPLTWAPASGCHASGTATASGSLGQGTFTVRPSASMPVLRVTAYADVIRNNTQDPTEAAGAATAAGIEPPTVPRLTTVAFDTPVVRIPQGQAKGMDFTARRSEGAPYTGTVNYTVREGTKSYTSSTSAGQSGSGTIWVVPMAETPVTQILAYADGNDNGSQEPTEVAGSASVVGMPPTSPADVAVLAFVPPVIHTAQGTTANLAFTALRGNTSTPWGTQVCYTKGAPAVPGCTETTSVSAGSIPVTPTAATPVVNVFAFIDLDGDRVQDAFHEVMGAAAVVGVPTITPPTGATVTLTPVPPTPQGTTVQVPFTARKLDTSNFSGTVRYGTAGPGTVPELTSIATATNGSGSIPVTPTSATPVVQVFAYADADGDNTPDATEPTAAVAVVGTPPPPGPSDVSAVTFVPPVAQAPYGTTARLDFTARRGNGTTIPNAEVRYSDNAGAPLTKTAAADAGGNGTIQVTPTSSNPAVPVIAYVDSLNNDKQDPTEVLGGAAVVGIPTATPPSGTTVVFDEPVSATAQGTVRTLNFTARNLDTTPFSGIVWYVVEPVGSTRAYGSEKTISGGRGSIEVPVAVASPHIQVRMFADRPGAQAGNTPDATELPGVAAIVAVPPVTAPETWRVEFPTPVVTAPFGSEANVRFTVRRGTDGPVGFQPIHWKTAKDGVAFTRTAMSDASGNGTIRVTPTLETPVWDILAFVDYSGNGMPEPPVEVVSAAAAVGTTDVTPPPVTVPSGTTVTFKPTVPPAQGSPATVSFAATKLDGAPFTGRVRYGTGSADSALTFDSYVDVTAADGTGSFTVTPTAATPAVRVVAYADRSGDGYGAPNETEARGVTGVVGVPSVTPPPAPQPTLAVVVPHLTTWPQGSNLTMSIIARRPEATGVNGLERQIPYATLRYSLGGPHDIPSFDNLVTADASGHAYVTVTPTSATPVLDLMAYVDDNGNGSPDAAELPGNGTVVGTPGVTPPSVPSGTAVVFKPTAPTPQGSPATVSFVATNLDGSFFKGRVRYGTGSAESPMTFGSNVDVTSNDGTGSFTVTPTAATPEVRVVAYADRPGAGYTTRDDTEATGVTAVVGTPPPPSPSNVSTVTFDPAVVRTTPHTQARLDFTARRGDNTAIPFAEVRYAVAQETDGPELEAVTTAGADGRGTIYVTPTSAAPVKNVVAHVDSVDNDAPDPNELFGTAAAVGVTVPPVTAPTITTLVFDQPVAATAQGSSARLWFTRMVDGVATPGKVRWGTGSAPTYDTAFTVSTSDGRGFIDVTPTSGTSIKQVWAYADRDGLQPETPQTGEVPGTVGVVGVGVPPPTAVTRADFATPVATTPQDSTFHLTVTARRVDDTAIPGVAIRYSIGRPVPAPSFSSLATTDAAGNASIPITPTSSTPAVEAFAFVDLNGNGSPDAGELPGGAVVVGTTEVPPPTPSGTVVALVPGPPPQQGSPGTVSFVATNLDGTLFDGTVRYGTSLGSYPNEATAVDGTGSFPVTPTAETPVVQVYAYADRAGSGFQAQDTTEATGATAVVGVGDVAPPPVTVPSSGTVVLFDDNLRVAEIGSTVKLDFSAMDLEANPFRGKVRWGIGAPGTPPTYNRATDASFIGEGTLEFTLTASTMQVFAYADRGGDGEGRPDSTEATAVAAVTSTAPPPSEVSGTSVVFDTPVWHATPGVLTTLQFTARNSDTSPFKGTVLVRWGPVGSTPQRSAQVDTDDGTGFVSVPAEDGVLHVVAYADRPDNGSEGNPDTMEVPGSEMLVGDPA